MKVGIHVVVYHPYYWIFLGILFNVKPLNIHYKTPILYSFRRCPYAIRARLALVASAIKTEVREVILAEKPDELLRISPKATVPVLCLSSDTLIDESLDIMLWALSQSNAPRWLGDSEQIKIESMRLIEINDTKFKPQLDRYKYADRYPGLSIQDHRELAQFYLDELESKLQHNTYLMGDSLSLADVAIFPFIRQFAMVDRLWFDQLPFHQLRAWLDGLLHWNLFLRIMVKLPAWNQAASITYLPHPIR